MWAMCQMWAIGPHVTVNMPAVFHCRLSDHACVSALKTRDERHETHFCALDCTQTLARRRVQPGSIFVREEDSLHVFILSWGSACFCADDDVATVCARASIDSLQTLLQQRTKRSSMATDVWHTGALMHLLLYSQLSSRSGSGGVCGAYPSKAQGAACNPACACSPTRTDSQYGLRDPDTVQRTIQYDGALMCFCCLFRSSSEQACRVHPLSARVHAV